MTCKGAWLRAACGCVLLTAMISIPAPQIEAQAASASTAAPSSKADAGPDRIDDDASKLPQFEVVSVKPHKDDPGSGMMIGVRFTPDGITASGLPLKMLLRESFGVSEDRVTGDPAWAENVRFDIDAKVDAADAPALDKIKGMERWKMLIPVLKDRFGLKYHHETRVLQVYALVVAKGGSKLSPSKPTEGAGKDGPRMMMRMDHNALSMESANAPVTEMTRVLASQLHSTVVDKTGLTGKFDYKLTWAPEQDMPMMGGPGARPEGGAEPQPTGPSLFAALEEQLGLKLETKKEPVDVIVIDQVTEPSPN